MERYFAQNTKPKQTNCFCFALQERACVVRSLKGGYDRDDLSMFLPWP